MKNFEIIIIANTIAAIKAENRKLPIKLSYTLNKNYEALLNAYKPYEASYMELGIEDPDGDLTPEQRNALEQLKNLNVEVDMYKIGLEDILQADLGINELDIIQRYMLEEENG